MIGMTYRRPVWLRILFIAGTGLVPAALFLSVEQATWRHVWRMALGGMIYSFAIGALCWVVLPRVADFVLRLPGVRKWTLLVSVITAIAALGCFVASAVVLGIGWIRPQEFWGEYTQSLRVSVVMTLIFALSAFFYEVLSARLNAAQRAADRLQQTATEARLSSLESRVHPHFLFNTLNTISALIREDPARAERMVERLASLLRFSLDSNQQRLAPLALELRIVRDYLEIEKARFGARLAYTIECSEELSGIEVPPMSVQTLVENSVKYAVSARRGGASIEVRVRLEDGSPVIDVIDDGPGFDRDAMKAGHGLELLESRVAALWGSDAALEIAPGARGMRVSLRVPKALALPLVMQ